VETQYLVRDTPDRGYSHDIANAKRAENGRDPVIRERGGGQYAALVVLWYSV